MMDIFQLISENPKSATFIGLTVSSLIGYFYRARKEKHKNLKEALYVLLEIWHRLTGISRLNLNEILTSLLEEMKRRYPDAEVSETEMKAVEKEAVATIARHIFTGMFAEFPSYEKAYDAAVHKISLDDPVLAYQVSSVANVRKALAAIDGYHRDIFAEVDGSMPREFVESLKNRVYSYITDDLNQQLEQTIKSLAQKIA